jgi:polysaccharide biosynthesis protein PslH
MIYPGALTYSVNLEAVLYFSREILPRVRRQIPEAQLFVTGSYEGIPPQRLPRGDGLTLTGHLPDVRRAVAESSICVVPLLRGGGTRLKVLEAMALGTPVISTSKGVEGLEVTPGVHVQIADRPDQFVSAVVRLLEDPERGRAMATQARELIRERYTWDRIGDLIERVLERAVSMEPHHVRT